MPEAVRLSLDTAERLATAALRANRVSAEAAASTARALVAAEADGQTGHGLTRVPAYAAQARAGKVQGHATPRAAQVAPAAVRIDAGLGFAYPAIDLAIERLVPLTTHNGIGVAAVHRSHHFGQVGAHAERLAREGLVALIFGNTPKAMPFWGGRTAALGTNPLAFAVPWPSDRAAPLVIDLALSVVARGKIVAAQRAGKSIPPDWAVDKDGQPTTDPSAALAGTLLPIGGAKGGALALMVEILGAALTGSSFGWEASSFFDAQGAAPSMGHLFIAIEGQRLSGGAFESRMRSLAEEIARDRAVRLPGSNRLKHRERAQREGVQIDADLHAQLVSLANPAT